MPAYCRTLGRVILPFERQIYGAVQIGHDSKPQVKTPTIMSDFDFLIMPDRGDESDATVDGAQASLACLNDDVIMLVVAFLPACRDVLSLSRVGQQVGHGPGNRVSARRHRQPRRSHLVHPGGLPGLPVACSFGDVARLLDADGSVAAGNSDVWLLRRRVFSATLSSKATTCLR